MGHLQCPQCRSVVTVVYGQRPGCLECGYGNPPRPKPPEPEPVVRGPATEVPKRWVMDQPVTAQEVTRMEVEAHPEQLEWDHVAPDLPGKPRGFAGVLVLSLITLGLYGIYYWYQVFREVAYHQQQPHHANLVAAAVVFAAVAGIAPWMLEPGTTLALVMGAGILGAVASWVVYLRIHLVQLQGARSNLELDPGIGGAELLAWSTLGIALLGLGPLIGWAKVNRSLSDYWLWA